MEGEAVAAFPLMEAAALVVGTLPLTPEVAILPLTTDTNDVKQGQRSRRRHRQCYFCL